MSLAPDAQQRLDALRRFLVVDAPEEDELARLVRVAALVYGVNYAVLTLRDGDRERLGAAYGLGADVFGPDSVLIERPPGPALPVTVPDATQDARFARNPVVHGPAGARFFAGVPLKSAHGFTLGTLAVLDPEAQEMNGEGLALLVDLGALVEPVLTIREARSDRDTVVAERDALAAERDAVVAERDTLVTAVNALTVERDAALAAASAPGPWADVLDAAPAAVVVAAPDGAVIHANAAARALLGLGDDGASLTERIDPADAPLLATLLGGLTSAPVEAGFRGADGSTLPLRLSAAPVPSAGEGAVVLAIRDLSARRAVEAALHAQEEALSAARAEAEAARAEAAEARAQPPRGELLAAVRHELRSTLTGLIGYAELFADGSDPEHQEMARVVGTAGERLLRLVTNTLDLARLDAPGAPLAPVEVGTVVEGAARPFRQPAQARDLALHVEIPADPVYARVDAPALAGILDALLANALAHTRQGGVRVRVIADHGRVVVEVQDTGVGMDEATLARALSDTFVGVGRAAGGVGLGVALARRLAERMDAELTGHSVAGQGSVFRVALRPAVPAAPPVVPSEGTVPAGDGAAYVPAA